ncbi:hypothetical protein Tco_1288665, partial [Tanacetum coccineum]
KGMFDSGCSRHITGNKALLTDYQDIDGGFVAFGGSNRSDIKHAEFDEPDTHVLERFNTSAGNPVKEILLKLNLPDHRILKDRGEGQDKGTSSNLKSMITTSNHKLKIEDKRAQD